MHHCSGGPGPNQFDMLTALENWVEKDAAPQSIIATHATEGRWIARVRSVRIRRRPSNVGTGSIDEAANFNCQLP